ncbi:MAG: hypothetical protein ACNS64_04405, partial [Candidatus Halalkalibacterium sp. M3_1C_030]
YIRRVERIYLSVLSKTHAKKFDQGETNMTYILESISMISLVIDYGEVELTSLAVLWNEYSGLVAVMSLALMSTVSLDQFTLLRGKFPQGQETTGIEEVLLQQPIVQLLKYQFLSGTREESIFLTGADKIGPLRFFLYNLCSTLIWLSVIFLAGMVLRFVITYFIGRFGPLEFEAVVGILTVYLTGLTGMMTIKKIKST